MLKIMMVAMHPVVVISILVASSNFWTLTKWRNEYNLNLERVKYAFLSTLLDEWNSFRFQALFWKMSYWKRKRIGKTQHMFNLSLKWLKFTSCLQKSFKTQTFFKISAASNFKENLQFVKQTWVWINISRTLSIHQLSKA